MIHLIEANILVSGNGWRGDIASWFWTETKREVIYRHENKSDREAAYDNVFSKAYDNIMQPLATRIKIPEIKRSYFSYILEDLKK